MSGDQEQLHSKDLPKLVGGSSQSGSRVQIGPYRLLQKVGEGGMGEVFEAEQTEPVRRRVALKVIKAGMDSKEVVARFEVERQALALMDHPCVAKVFEAGATERGAPYFAMEFVQGVPINEHCDRHKLTTRERLELFIQVCDGVQHAHQKAIIHRDLKPTNVLVSVSDGRVVPKIIDFGVAKAMSQKLTDRTMYTEIGMMIGTPEYMSPEQAEMTGQDVDTRTDVYSLGVILYQLLVGSLPFGAKELRSEGFDGFRRKIREEEPERPSTRLAAVGENSNDAAQKRRVDLMTLRRQLRGDLDWITMKALEKSPTRRYGSPHELAADLGRYLTDQPVLASPPSATYRTKKFMRRHKMGAGVALAAVFVLIGFAATVTLYAKRLTIEIENTRSARTRAESAGKFLSDLLKEFDPKSGKAVGGRIAGKVLLDEGKARLDELEQEPILRAELQRTIGELYYRLGEPADAEDLLTRSVEFRERQFGRDALETQESNLELAKVQAAQLRFAEAVDRFDEVIATLKAKLGSDARATLTAQVEQGLAYWKNRHFEEAEEILRRTIAAQKRALGTDHEDTLRSMGLLGLTLYNLHRDDEAEKLLHETLNEQKRVLEHNDFDVLETGSNLANVYSRKKRYVEARELHLEVLAIRRAYLDPAHPSIWRTMYNLACIEALQEHRTEAIDWLDKSIEAGFNKFDDMSTDPDLELLHGPAFDDLLARARRNGASIGITPTPEARLR